MLDLKETGYALATVTESTARAVMPFSGKNDKNGADRAAVDNMRSVLDQLMLNLQIHLGEGEKDRAPMLYTGERLGQKKGEVDRLDLVVDPLECTTNFSLGLPDSLCVLLATPAGATRDVPGTYMEQMLVPPSAKPMLNREINFRTPVKEVMDHLSTATGKPVSDLTVVVQNRPRHEKLIRDLRETGAGVSLIESGSISAAAEIILRQNGRLDMIWGTFGAPEGLVLAAMANLSGFGFIGEMKPHDDDMKRRVEELGISGKVLGAEEWVGNQEVIVISGIHTSTWLPGVERRFLNGSESYMVRTLLWSREDKRILTHADGKMVDDSPYKNGSLE